MGVIPEMYKGKPLVHAWPYYHADGELLGWTGRYGHLEKPAISRAKLTKQGP
jgi:hypothetical protein